MSSIIYNGHEIQDLIVNGNQAQLWLNGQKLYPTEEPIPPVSETYTVEFSFSQYDDVEAPCFHVTSSSVSSSLSFYGQSAKGGAWNSLSSYEASNIIKGTSSLKRYGLKIEGIPSWTQFVLEATNPDPSLEEVDMAASIKVTSSTRGVIVNDSDSWGTEMMFVSVTVNIDSNMSTTWTWTDRASEGYVEDE